LAAAASAFPGRAGTRSVNDAGRIRRERIKALFLENMSDPRLMQEIARETDAELGPPLYSDALSGPGGPAPTYIRMIEYNTAALRAGMLKN
jgi:zinc/manganese transport system substrate-binding protein